MAEVIFGALPALGTVCYLCGATRGLARADGWLLRRRGRARLAAVVSGEVPHPPRRRPRRRRPQRRGPRSGR